MTLKLEDVLGSYTNPCFIIRPIEVDGSCEDFEYVYANEAFCRFLERTEESLVGHTYLDCFRMKGERAWLDLFGNVGRGQEHTYVESVSPVIGKKIFLEAFHVPGGQCCCVIHDYKDMREGLHLRDNSDLLRKAHCDYLTGFYNRFYLIEQYERLMAQDNVGVTALDINNLKQENDARGHAAGDELILRVSRMIRAMYRNSTVFRMGGDEFVIITLGMDKERFMAMSQCRKRIFEKNNLVAVGYRFFDHVDRLKDCIDMCDSLMYEHKRRVKEHETNWPSGGADA